MILVEKILDEAKSIIGQCDDEIAFRKLTDAVELLANKGDWDPLLCSLDICVDDRLVTLPREVEAILGLNMVGNPAVARDQIYRFHLNGPGQHDSCVAWEWDNMGESCIFRELKCPSRLVATCVQEDDENCDFRIYGFDQNENWIRTKVGDAWEDGWKVPVFRTVVALPADAPIFSRITRVRKPKTAGPLRLTTVDNTLLGIYQWNDTEPLFRRIKLSQKAAYVRIRCRLRTFEITSKTDLIPLHNSQAVLSMLRALKAYGTPGQLADAEGYEATATRWLTEEQYTRGNPVVAPIQVHDGAPLIDPGDHVD